MAEINTSDGGGKGGKKRSKKVSTKVDMTPMVDLAFLLITFFMLATTLQKQQIMTYRTPPMEQSPDPPELKASKAMTIILGEKDKVFYYFIDQSGVPEFFETDYSEEGIRKVLLERKKIVGAELSVVVKPMETSTYQNFVDMMDEFAITGIERKIFDKITDLDLELVAKEESLEATK
ncbi:MAG: biopolymer transporter ExbD [Cytophagaceae bacterium]|jgi:biopolymer transport protein ExbD|nr:biopolymer transporter ExbD [Cytophagaceae bacterium]